MNATSKKFFNSIRLRRATLLVLFALASLQLILAVHQFDHSASSVAEPCHVCAQADRLDDALVVDVQLPVDSIEVQADEPRPLATLLPVASYRSFPPRAPPKI